MPGGSLPNRQKAVVMQWYVPDHRQAASTGPDCQVTPTRPPVALGL